MDQPVATGVQNTLKVVLGYWSKNINLLSASVWYCHTEPYHLNGSPRQEYGNDDTPVFLNNPVLGHQDMTGISWKICSDASFVRFRPSAATLGRSRLQDRWTTSKFQTAGAPPWRHVTSSGWRPSFSPRKAWRLGSIWSCGITLMKCRWPQQGYVHHLAATSGSGFSSGRHGNCGGSTSGAPDVPTGRSTISQEICVQDWSLFPQMRYEESAFLFLF